MEKKTLEPNKEEVKQALHDGNPANSESFSGVKSSDGKTPEKQDQRRQADQASGRDKH